MRISNVSVREESYTSTVVIHYYVSGNLKVRTRTLKTPDVDEIWLENKLHEPIKQDDVDLLIELLEISRVIELKFKGGVISQHRYHSLMNQYFFLVSKYKFYERQELLIL